MDFLRASLVLMSLFLMGCGGGPAPVAVQPPATPAAAEAAKSALQTVADTGELGSGLETLRTALEELKQSDSEKATALLADLDALEASSSPDAAKSKAKEMLGKL
jgi:hypothetical protein